MAAAAAVELWNPAPVVRWNADKRYLHELAETGIATVPTVWLERGARAEVGELAERHRSDRLVFKPVVANGARGLHRSGDGALAADQRALDALLAERATMVQPYLPEVERGGELSLLYAGDGRGLTLVGAVRKRAAPGDFRVQEMHRGSVAAATPTHAEHALAENALRHVRDCVEGGTRIRYARADLVTGLDGAPRLIELEMIEPRLYFRACPAMVERLADVVAAHLSE